MGGGGQDKRTLSYMDKRIGTFNDVHENNLHALFNTFICQKISSLQQKDCFQTPAVVFCRYVNGCPLCCLVTNHLEWSVEIYFYVSF